MKKETTVRKGKDKLWNFSFRSFHEIQCQGHFMNHEILSWNTFTLVSQCHCACFSSIQKLCWQTKAIFWQRKSNSINFDKYFLLKPKTKKSKRPKCIWMKPRLKHRNDKKACVSLFSEIRLTDKFHHYLQMNVISYYWSYNYFYILITFHVYITYTYNNTVCIDYIDASTVHVFHFTNNFFSITQLKQ